MDFKLNINGKLVYKAGAQSYYNVPIKQDKNFEKLNEPDIIKNSKLSGKKVHKNG